MKKRYKRYLSIAVTIVVMFGMVSIAEAVSFAFRNGSDLASLLESSIFSSFTTDKSFYNVGPLGLCTGELLDGCLLSSNYGWRRHPRRRRRHFHTGIDLSAPKGVFIYAPADGLVVGASRSRGYGKLVELDHGFAWNTKYAHMHKIYVKKGQRVKRGDILGEVGSTGVSTGPHLHFEMLYFGSTVDPRNHFAVLGDLKSPIINYANR